MNQEGVHSMHALFFFQTNHEQSNAFVLKHQTNTSKSV